LERIATELSARSGRDSPDTLAARSSVARAAEDALGAQEAIGLYTALLADQQRVLGPDDRNVLVTRENLARSTNASGDHAKAEVLYRDLAEDKTRIRV